MISGIQLADYFLPVKKTIELNINTPFISMIVFMEEFECIYPSILFYSSVSKVQN